MGSAPLGSTIPQTTVDTRYGVAKVSISKVLRTDIQPRQKYQAFVTLTMTNQSHNSPAFDQRGYEHQKDVFSFIINSRYQFKGRPLLAQLWEKGLLSNKSIGFGMIDLNEIAEHKDGHTVKVYFNREKDMVGWVQLMCTFEEMPAEPYSMMFQSALMRRKTSSTMKCQIKGVIGEEILLTRISEDKQDSIPSWRDDILTFYVIKGATKEGKISLMDGETEVGSLLLNLEEIMKSEENQIQIREEFYYEDNIAGTVRFFISRGKTKQFKVGELLRSIYVGSSSQDKNFKKLPAINNKPNQSLIPSIIEVKPVADKVDKSQLQRVQKQKQAQIDRLKKELQQNRKVWQQEKLKLVAFERENAEKLKLQNEQLSLKLGQAIQKVERSQVESKEAEMTLKSKQQEEFKSRINILEQQNERLKREGITLNNQLSQIKQVKESMILQLKNSEIKRQEAQEKSKTVDPQPQADNSIKKEEKASIDLKPEQPALQQVSEPLQLEAALLS